MQHALLGVRHSRRRILNFHGPKRSRNSHHHGTSLLCREATRCASSFTFPPWLRSGRPARTTPEDVTSDEDLTFSEALKKGIAQSTTRKWQSENAGPTTVERPPPGSARYGKWQPLSLDEDRLYHEIGTSTLFPHLVRYIDQPKNKNDLELWVCLLEFAHRRMGLNGVLKVWEALSKRRSLYLVQGPMAEAFWSTILNAAVTRDAILRDVIIYAEWMYATHKARLPQLYSTVVSYMLENGQSSEVLRWHITLTPSFGPDEAEFVGLMKKFVTRTDAYIQGTLRMLYTYNLHRKLYDILIPHLYFEGHTKLAMDWRRTFRRVSDTPVSLAARPFLRFVAAYYSRITLANDELKAAGLVKIVADEPGRSTSGPPGVATDGQNLSYLINRLHGETFGIQEQPYNDDLGARWFASSWVSLDFAINVIYTMGMEEIGPLSLQSIALREGSARGLQSRLDQLQRLKINLPKSHYVEAIRHYAVAGNDEALQELLQCDIHPDVFDDEAAQDGLLKGCLSVGDWATYRLVLRTRLAVLSNSITTSSDSVLQACAYQGNGPMALTVLQEMLSHGLDLAPMTSHILSSFVLQDLSKHADSTQPREVVDLHISLCRHLAASRFPPAVEVWQTLLYRLGREQRLLELERLCSYIVQLFTDYTTSEQPMWMSHMADTPEILRSESPYPDFQSLPRDFPISHENHPLSQIFDKKMQNTIVRWGFTYTRYDREAEAAAAAVVQSAAAKGEDGSCEDAAARVARTPADFHFARGIRLLAMLRDRGLRVLSATVRKQALLRLDDLYRGGGRATYKWIGENWFRKQARRRNRLSLAEAKVLCDEAWGAGEILPSLFNLGRQINKTDKEDALNSVKNLGAIPKRR